MMARGSSPDASAQVLREVSIDAGPPCARTFGPDDAVIVVDVIRSTTTAITAASLGARCLPVPTVEAAWARARTLRRPLLVGERGGERPDGFDLTNSPVEVARRPDLRERPVVLLSSSGTPLMEAVSGAGAVYLACLRNRRAVAEHAAQQARRVVVMGAATRGELREEDQLVCAHIAEHLAARGFAVADERTARLIARWSGAPPEAFLASKSVDYLRRSGQLHDLEFILDHVDDLDEVFELCGGELVPAERGRARCAI
jgi:2-phosphosulfolactate phosphatase